MLASFIIRFHSRRTENLCQTLRFLEKWHKNVISQSQLILACQDSVEPVPNSFKKYDHLNLNLKCMMLAKQTNEGVKHAVSDKIVLLDGDRIAYPNYYEKMLPQAEKGKQISIKTIKNMEFLVSDEELESNEYKYWEEQRNTSKLGQRCMWSGNTIFIKDDFYEAGMMDEEYKGYGFEDQDMSLTMEKSGVESILAPDHEIHLWHERQTYGEGDQKQLFINNGLHFCKKWNMTIPDFLREEIIKHKKSWI